ncbi:MAG: fumarylacetoacetate hydrolase, partial [Acidobacteria bacterium]|nr:fumarylacetoacetate hydrolase [Acidobacteriota bacterium]
MRIVGIRRDGGVQVAALTDDGASVTVLAGLEEFWADARGHLS